MKKEFKLEKIRHANLFVIGEPKALFTPDEINILKQYLEEGGNLLIIQGEQGDTKNNTNLNNFLKDYGELYFFQKISRIDTLSNELVKIGLSLYEEHGWPDIYFATLGCARRSKMDSHRGNSPFPDAQHSGNEG